MNIINKTERGLIASLFISDIASVLLLFYNVFYFPSGGRAMIPIFLMIMPAIYVETKKRLEAEENRIFQYRSLLWALLICLIITESVNLVLSIFL
ncbi:MAG: hypothetical protein ACW990_05785 [Promethearchaeota archaeon]|jgi:hypothetical protein